MKVALFTTIIKEYGGERVLEASRSFSWRVNFYNFY